jgi:HEPN superfamily RiboL-PSP-like protein
MTGRAEVARLRRRLDATFARAPVATADIEIQADFARYLCVLLAGFLENALITLMIDVAQRRSAPDVARFVERRLDRWANPNTERIANLVGDFDPDWYERVTRYLIDERKESVNSLMALRHKIAHGESVGTSLAQVRDYYAAILEVVDFVTELVDPPRGLVAAP